MAAHRYIGSGSLFDDESTEDVDDATFLRGARVRPSPGADPAIAALETQRQTLEERRQGIEQRTLDSSTRSVSLLRDSERIGVATAEELLRQREQLENSAKRLDEINANLRFSQKHINGIRSVFSSLKNYISGKSDALPKFNGEQAAAETPRAFPNSVSGNLYDDHPSTRLRDPDYAAGQRQLYSGEASGSKRINELLEANLDEMNTSITRLKGLAINLGEEINSQNDLIDDVHYKVEKADGTINSQNKQMNKILGK